METTLRRSSRLRKLEAIRAEAELLASQVRETSNQQCRRNKPASKFLELSTEIRLLIYSHIITTERPFLIGRCQEERRRKTEGSPRDIASGQAGKPKRNERRNRPKQPPITRVCRTFREEALSLWYSENRFWLIHNEYEPDIKVPNPPRGFDAWISQTPRGMFDFMQHVSLCGYTTWPNRMMISIDLKNRRLVSARHYSTYGHELPIYQEDSIIGSTRRALASKADEDGLAALQAVLADQDGMFQISKWQVSAPPGRLKGVAPAAGWEYDW